MKKKVIVLWSIFVICVVGAVTFRFLLNQSEPEYKEVQVKVISATTKQVKNRKNGSTYNFYDVKVEYEGKTYDLKNAHSTSQYTRGRQVKAYLAGGKIFADIDGVKTSTPVGKIYFVFLFGSIIMLFVASVYTSKLSKKEN